MKLFKNLQVSINFAVNFLIISLVSGLRPLPNHLQLLFPKFSKFSLNFRENFEKVLKFFRKIAKFPLNFSKNYNIHWFLIFLKLSSLKKTRMFDCFNVKTYPHCSRDPPPSAKSCINYWFPMACVIPLIWFAYSFDLMWRTNV